MALPTTRETASRATASIFKSCLSALIATSTIGLVTSACVPATNPFDPDTPADLQAKAGVRGRAAFPVVDGYLRPAQGIVVALESTEDPTTRFEFTTDQETQGAFLFRDVTPGAYILRATANGYVARTNEIQLQAGEERDVGTIELGLSTDTAAVSGSVIIAENFASNARVALVRADPDGSCPAGNGAPPAFVTLADAAGTFSFSSVPEGTYQAWVLDPSYTPSSSEVFTITAENDVVVAPITVQKSSALLTVLGGEGAGVVATNTRDVELALVDFGDMEQMRFFEDNEGNATTEWTSFAEAFTYSIEGDEGERTLLLRLRNACVTTPHYPTGILFDQTPPLFLSSTIFGREGVAQPEPPRVVLGNTAGSIPVQSRAFDVAGISGVEFIVNGVPQNRVAVGPTAPFQASLVTAQAPLENGEGASTVEVLLVDVAGNVTPTAAQGNENAVIFRVIRDLSAPGTPLPTAEELTVTSPTTLLWLDERDCPNGQNESPFVCEANPPAPIIIDSPIEGLAPREASPLFLIRGGPDYPDFTPVIGPPFHVRVFVSGDTLFEIQAQDDAGNLSPGVARVLVHREEADTLFTAPNSFVLSPSQQPQLVFAQSGVSVLPPKGRPDGITDRPLVASGGTALFSLAARPGVTQETYYSYVVAQSVTQPPVGLDRLSSPFPTSIRKLSTSIENADDTVTFPTYLYRRRVPSVGVLFGSLSWLEYNPVDYFNMGLETPRPNLMVTAPNKNGFYALDSLFDIYRTDSDLVDADGEPAPGIVPNFFSGELFFGSGGFLEDCLVIGDTRCAKIDAAWGGANERGPSEFVGVGDRVVFNGAGLVNLPLSSAPTETVDVTGPRLVMARLSQPGAGSLIRFGLRSIDLEIGVPAGTQLRTVAFSQINATELLAANDLIADLPISVAKGAPAGETRVETLLIDDEAQFDTFLIDVGGEDVPRQELVGVFIPEGVTATIQLAAHQTTGPFQTSGVAFRDPLVDGNFLERQPIDDPNDRDDVTLAMRVSGVTHGPDADVSTRSGLSTWNLGPDRLPTPGPITAALIDEGVSDLASIAEESQAMLAIEPHQTENLGIASPSTTGLPQVPEGACMMVFRPEEDIEIGTLRLKGSGILDDTFLRGFVWRSTADSAFGDFELDPTFRPGFPFTASGDAVEEQGVSSCIDVVQENQVVAEVSGTIAAPVVDTTIIAGALDNVIYAGEIEETAAGVFQHFHDEASPIAVTPGDVVSVIMSDTNPTEATGDGDLHMRFGGPASLADWDCRPYRVGNFEVCSGYVVPDGVTELYVAVDTYTAPINVRVAVLSSPPGTNPVRLASTVPVAPGDILTVQSSNTTLDVFAIHDIYVRWDAAPTTDDNDCEGSTRFETSTCRLIVPDGVTEAYIGVRPSVFTGSETWDLDISVTEAGSIVEIAQIALADGTPFNFQRVGGGDASLLIRRTEQDEVNNNLVQEIQCDTTDPLTLGAQGCGCDVDDTTGDIVCAGRGAGGGGPPEIHTFYLVGQPGVGGSFNATLDVPQTGCTESESIGAAGILRAGNVYAITIGDSTFNNATDLYGPTLNWIDDDGTGNTPQMNFATGAAAPELGFVGSITEGTKVLDRLIVTNLDASAPRCEIEFQVPRRTEFHHLTASNETIFAARTRHEPDGSGTLTEKTVLMAFDPNVPVDENSPGEILVELSPGSRVLDSKWLRGDRPSPDEEPAKYLAWVESDETGLVQVRTKRLDVESDICDVAILNPIEDYLSVTLARFNESIDDRIVVAGNARVRPEARLYRLNVAPNCESSLEEKGRRILSAPPVAAAYEGGDLFLWNEDTEPPLEHGGELRHFDLRDPTIVHPGGRLSVTGFDVDGGDIALALSPEVGRRGTLNEVVNGDLVRHRLDTDTDDETLFFHPRYIGTDGLATMGIRYNSDTGESSSSIWLFARGNDETPPVELASAAVYLVPATVTADPLENARSPVLESDGDLLALLGFQNGTDNRALTVFRLPSGREGSATPIGTVVSVAADVSQVYVTEDLVTLVFQNGNARVFQVGNGLVEIDVDVFDEDGTSLFIRQERVIGAADGNLLVLKNPGNLFAVSAPLHLDIEIRPVEAFSEDLAGPWPCIRLPAGAFVHAFPSVAAVGDDYLLYDDRATPPVLWHTTLDGKNGTPDDGPSRPLTGGTDRIGVSAMPRVDGSTVYYVRGVGNGGRALMRYQRE